MLESLSSDELQFIKAIEKYKAESGKIFLSWTEVLTILHDLGYRKVAKPQETSCKKDSRSRRHRTKAAEKRRAAQAESKSEDSSSESKQETKQESKQETKQESKQESKQETTPAAENEKQDVTETTNA